MRRLEWWHSAWQDIRLALRSYRREPLFTSAVLLTLGVGIGATTAFFSLVDAALIGALPYPEPDRLVHLWEIRRNDPSDHLEASYPDFVDWRAERGVFAALEGYDETNVSVSDASGADWVRGARVTSGLFALLGVSPARGRVFDSTDDVSGGTQNVVLSHGFWVSRFGAAEDIVGRAIQIDGVPHQILGVLPPQFHFAPVGDAGLWLPIGRSSETRAQRFNYWINVVGRLQPGVTIDAARRRVTQVMSELATRYPETNGSRDAVVTQLREEVVAGTQRALLVLLGAVGIVLLIACANVAGLIFIRSVKRFREIAVRSALGASHARIIRQLLAENFVLAFGGAALGMWLASLGVPLLLRLMPDNLFDQMPALRGAAVDLSALAFAAVAALLSGIVFGLAPALVAARRNAAELMRSGIRAGAAASQNRVQHTLVMVQVALTLVLLVSATLLGRSLLELLRVDPGFTAERVATVRVALAGPSYRENARQQRFFEELLERVRVLPGVDATGAISSPPLQGGGTNRIRIDGAAEPAAGAYPEATLRAVAGDYFDALRITLLSGRVVDARDDLTAPYVFVISESAALRLFRTRDVVGRRLRVYGWQDSAWTVVGVVRDVKTNALDQPPVPTLYYSHLHGPANRMSVVARASSIDPVPLIAAMRREVRALDPSVAVYATETMVQQIRRSAAINYRRYLVVVLGAFALAALALAIVGIYGVIAYTVEQRDREVAIRMALGATAGSVLALVSGTCLRMAAVGVVVGVVAALALTRALSALLFGVSAADPITYALVSLLLVSVVLLASYVPARRATRVDPAAMLRSE